MTSALLPEKKKEVTEKQKKFLNCLFVNKGDIALACEEAGYSPSSRTWLVKSLADEIIDISKRELAVNSATAVSRVVESMNDDGLNPRQELRLKAAQTLLDRVGLGKIEKQEHDVRALHGIVLMPSKSAMPSSIDASKHPKGSNFTNTST